MIFNWDTEKNKILKQKRNTSFEEIVICILENKIRAVLENPNRNKYPNQKLYLIEYNNYIYVVPFVRKGKDEIFLKTIYPSRKYTEEYLGR